MKHIKIHHLLAAGAIAVVTLLPSCKKYLDQQPITANDPAKVFNDVPGAYSALIGAYSRLMGDNGYGIRISLYFTVDNDEMQGPTGNGNDNDRRDIARYQCTPGNAQITNPFLQLFNGIENANMCIDYIPKMELYTNGTDQQKKQLQRMYGEALTLRAQFYFEAIRNWGDLPAHFTAAQNQALQDPFPTRTSSDSLYDRLLEDLKTAEDLVPWVNDLGAIGDSKDERITKGTVKGLRARIALFRGGYALRPASKTMERSTDYLKYYQIARDETYDIIQSGQHSLNPSFKSLWKDQVCAHAVSDPNNELLFQASASGSGSAEDSKLGYYNGPRVNGKGNSSINPLPTYFYLFDSMDLRRDVTIAPYFVAADGITKIGQAITAINDGKYRRDWVTNPSFDPNDAIQYLSLKWQLLRYADVLLMFAEAENEISNGPTANAYNALNWVRRRGFGKNINTVNAAVDVPAGLSKTDFFKYIVRERALELGGEGIRKFDLIRWNLLATALTETKANLLTMSTNTAIANPSYMAGYPAYCLTTILPKNMYYQTTATGDDHTIWANSYYNTAPSSTPAGTTKVNWLTAAINTTGLARFATGFTVNKSELLPIPQPAIDANKNLVQNPGY
ncbi:hypothetical protein A8C56_23425 [Niabella ginsenosidivorans]|uniref:Carbohydrate-binding protein SusD n=1 Tax=Niabella ginsenosidivorans TaxID=1176587 RepID=A0A1A9I7H1_9BACT|nr:RagB/SusD family nutrient uptake outer membrane protein [Niabella ginsenosidivorans]ANH83533.1 hypothetical protein A8C56_23425 [Niabella ginsenosidivorans]